MGLTLIHGSHHWTWMWQCVSYLPLCHVISILWIQDFMALLPWISVFRLLCAISAWQLLSIGVAAAATSLTVHQSPHHLLWWCPAVSCSCNMVNRCSTGKQHWDAATKDAAAMQLLQPASFLILGRPLLGEQKIYTSRRGFEITPKSNLLVILHTTLPLHLKKNKKTFL